MTLISGLTDRRSIFEERYVNVPNNIHLFVAALDTLFSPLHYDASARIPDSAEGTPNGDILEDEVSILGRLVWRDFKLNLSERYRGHCHFLAT